MTVYKVDFQFKYQTEYWTNKLYVNAASGALVDSWIEDEVAPILAGAIQTSVELQKARVTAAPFTANTYHDVSLNMPGTGGSTPPAPLFNVVRWEFSKPIGRTVFHYFRGGVTPSNIGTDQNFTSAAKTFNDSVVTALGDTSLALCDKLGATYTRFGTALAVGMHQLRRGSKRKTTPVI